MNKRTGIKGFLTTAMAFAAAAQAGIARDLASFKGGFNRKGHGKKSGGKTSRAPYVWGTLGTQEHKYPESRYEQKHSVIKQYQKSEAYKSKINSKQWKKAAKEVAE